MTYEDAGLILTNEGKKYEETEITFQNDGIFSPPEDVRWTKVVVSCPEYNKTPSPIFTSNGSHFSPEYVCWYPVQVKINTHKEELDELQSEYDSLNTEYQSYQTQCNATKQNWQTQIDKKIDRRDTWNKGVRARNKLQSNVKNSVANMEETMNASDLVVTDEQRTAILQYSDYATGKNNSEYNNDYRFVRTMSDDNTVTFNLYTRNTTTGNTNSISITLPKDNTELYNIYNIYSYITETSNGISCYNSTPNQSGGYDYNQIMLTWA